MTILKAILPQVTGLTEYFEQVQFDSKQLIPLRL